MINKLTPLYGCESCREEHSWPAEDLRQHGDEIWCCDCWDNCDMKQETGTRWSVLPPFVPEHERKILTRRQFRSVLSPVTMRLSGLSWQM